MGDPCDGYKDLLERVVALEATATERDRRMEQRFQDQESVRNRFLGELSDWKTTHNDLQRRMDNQAQLFITKTEYEHRLNALIDKIDGDVRFLSDRMSRMDNSRNELGNRIVAIETAAAVTTAKTKELDEKSGRWVGLAIGVAISLIMGFSEIFLRLAVK